MCCASMASMRPKIHTDSIPSTVTFSHTLTPARSDVSENKFAILKVLRFEFMIICDQCSSFKDFMCEKREEKKLLLHLKSLQVEIW